MRALSRFGARFLPAETPPGVRPRAALSALLLAYLAPVPEAAGARWRIVLEGQPFELAVDERGVARLVADAIGEPDEVRELGIAELAELRRAHRPYATRATRPSRGRSPCHGRATSATRPRRRRCRSSRGCPPDR